MRSSELPEELRGRSGHIREATKLGKSLSWTHIWALAEWTSRGFLGEKDGKSRVELSETLLKDSRAVGKCAVVQVHGGESKLPHGRRTGMMMQNHPTADRRSSLLNQDLP